MGGRDGTGRGLKDRKGTHLDNTHAGQCVHSLILDLMYKANNITSFPCCSQLASKSTRDVLVMNGILLTITIIHPRVNLSLILNKLVAFIIKFSKSKKELIPEILACLCQLD